MTMELRTQGAAGLARSPFFQPSGVPDPGERSMSIKGRFRPFFVRPRRVVGAAAWVAALVLAAPWPMALAQSERYKGPIHYPWPPQPPIGSVGQYQLQRNFSPTAHLYVRFAGPEGMKVRLLASGPDGKPAATALSGPATIALQVGPVYRVAISGLPDHPGLVLYPTLEAIDYLQPPKGVGAEDFPISIRITEDMIAHAEQSRLVTEVFYLEDPELAMPAAEPGQGPLTQVGLGENPLRVADVLGRPMLIFRLGGRVPLDG